jgi:putative Holliday junction resolvase
MSSDRGLLLAIDYGLKRIGIASANTLTRTATPLTTLDVTDGPPWSEIDRLIAEWQPGCIVIGLPSVDPALPIRKAVDTFIVELRGRIDIPVATVDEAFTSTAAAAALKNERQEGIRRRRVTKADLDQHAACLIAEQWMSSAYD